MILTIQGKVLSINLNEYTNEETQKSYISWRVFFLDSNNNFNPTFACSFDYEQGKKIGLDNPEIVSKLINQEIKLTTNQPVSYQNKIIPTFNTLEIIKQ